MKHLHMKDGLDTYLLCSFITGFILTLASSPVDVMKTRIMSQNF